LAEADSMTPTLASNRETVTHRMVRVQHADRHDR